MFSLPHAGPLRAGAPPSAWTPVLGIDMRQTTYSGGAYEPFDVGLTQFNSSTWRFHNGFAFCNTSANSATNGNPSYQDDDRFMSSFFATTASSVANVRIRCPAGRYMLDIAMGLYYADQPITVSVFDGTSQYGGPTTVIPGYPITLPSGGGDTQYTNIQASQLFTASAAPWLALTESDRLVLDVTDRGNIDHTGIRINWDGNDGNNYSAQYVRLWEPA